MLQRAQERLRRSLMTLFTQQKMVWLYRLGQNTKSQTTMCKTLTGDEPCQTAVYEAESLGVLIARWQWAESEVSVQSVFEQLTIKDFKDPEEEIEYKVDDNSLLLFDSVLSGKDAEGLSVTLAGSIYLVSTICYTPHAINPKSIITIERQG